MVGTDSPGQLIRAGGAAAAGNPLQHGGHILGPDYDSGGAGVVARAGTVGAATFLTTVPSILVFAIMRGKVMETMSFSGIKS